MKGSLAASGLVRITAVVARITPFGTMFADAVGPQLKNAVAHTVLLVFRRAH